MSKFTPEQVKVMYEALQEISHTFPSEMRLNLNALPSDPDIVKFANNHQYIARQALAKADGK